MSSLPTPLRRQLESAVKQARKVAAAGARKALEALAVHEGDPYAYMDAAQIELRRKLRAQAVQLGDKEVLGKPDSCEIKHLVEKLAYDQWHRLLFARYLVENNLLISPEHGVSVSLEDCEELAPSLGLKDSWAVAARFAAKELPEIFRADDPAGAVELPAENRKPLIQLVTGLPVEVFTAADSLGWCYQFWQAERKDEINVAGNKIGADELPAVTQLFTEDYMVDFLLDNTLGAWHAGRRMATNPQDSTLAKTAQSEDELRAAMALPGCPWSYLRFIKGEDGKWTPAAGTFDSWPKTIKKITCLDPSMGSGHFIVAMFGRLVALRVFEENLDAAEAVAKVIHDNLFGLEIDPRCTQIAAFNLALTAWRSVGHCALPPMNLACSGLAPNTSEADWLKITGGNQKLQLGMKRLYGLFQKAPILGSLINPPASDGDLFEAGFGELQPLLEEAMTREAKDETAHEMAVTARGLASAASILIDTFTLVATNPPYLVKGKQDPFLQAYLEKTYPLAASDLATCFIERIDGLVAPGGVHATVTPQNWMYLKSYEKFRRELLSQQTLTFFARVGSGATSQASWDVLRALCIWTKIVPELTILLSGLDAPAADDIGRAACLGEGTISASMLKQILASADARITLGLREDQRLLNRVASAFQGVKTGDDARLRRQLWEVAELGERWRTILSTTDVTLPVAGMNGIVDWLDNGSMMARRQGIAAWGRSGVAASQMRCLPCVVYQGDIFDSNVSAIVPTDPSLTPALWAFCTSDEFNSEVRKVDQSLAVTNGSLAQIHFDEARWSKVATEKYPHGLPKPFSSDPTQWLFNGHPKGSDNSLHVAVGRLLGYSWPRQTGSSFHDCPAIGPDGLEALADADGIVCLHATKGKPAAAERLRVLLAQAYGEDWSASVQQNLLAQVGYAGKTLDDWLREGFFEQHCALFHHRPFIWHIWDGNKSGFSALVNYHQLNHATLESLTYAYLGDWIRRQRSAVDAGEAGSDARLQAAKQLEAKLKLILEGEPRYDLFVRWKPLSQQAIGWHPDLNDGVRMNIRPFATADILRKRVKIKWDKDRGKEPVREQKDFPWFWGWDGKTQDFAGVGTVPDGNRWNDCHYTNELKRKARGE